MKKTNYQAKCPYCGFNNELRVKEGVEPKICCSCSKDITYKKLEQEGAPENQN